MDAKMRAFLALMEDAFSFATRAHDCSFDDPADGQKEDKCCALSYAAACIAKYSAAESIYWCTPDLEHEEIPELFAKFDIFTHEVMSDFEADHSRQWVSIEYENLKKLFNSSVCAQQAV